MTRTGAIALVGAALAVACSGAAASVEPVEPTGAPTEPSPPADPFADAVAALAQPLIDGEWLAGVSIALVRGDDVYYYGFGRASAKQRHSPDADTIYEIGSVTKAFTGLLLADAVGRFLVELDDPVARYVAEGRTVPSFDGRPITLEQLATHTSGLPRMPSNFAPADPDNPFADYDEDAMYAFLAGHALARAPGQKYEYSNLATGLLGHVLARRAGRSFEQLVIERVCAPLGMSDTVIAVDEPRAERVAIGHDGEGHAVAAWDIPTLAGAGALRSTARDMVAFVRANLAADHRVLGPAMKLTQEPLAATDQPGGRIGLGWHITGDGTRWHNGQTGGFHSFVAFRPDERLGVVVLANTAAPLGDALGQALLLLLAGEPYELRLPTTVQLDERLLEGYVGTYRLAPDFIVSISRDGARLYAQATGLPRLRMYASSDTEFYLRVTEARLRFEVGEGGRATALVLIQDGHEQRGPRL